MSHEVRTRRKFWLCRSFLLDFVIFSSHWSGQKYSAQFVMVNDKYHCLSGNKFLLLHTNVFMFSVVSRGLNCYNLGQYWGCTTKELYFWRGEFTRYLGTSQIWSDVFLSDTTINNLHILEFNISFLLLLYHSSKLQGEMWNHCLPDFS